MCFLFPIHFIVLFNETLFLGGLSLTVCVIVISGGTIGRTAKACAGANVHRPACGQGGQKTKGNKLSERKLKS